jgi:cell division protein FtsB
MSGTYGIPRIVRLELEQSAIARANQELRINLIDADRVRYMLKHDRAYIEQVARTRYHMARPNETVYRYSGQ